MVRDTTEGKSCYLNVLFGPLLDRWAAHTTKGRTKYPDVAPGVPNWTLAQGVEAYLRAKDSAFRHMIQWLRGDRDEDHAAAVAFNINLAEYVLERCPEIRPSLGAAPPAKTTLAEAIKTEIESIRNRPGDGKVIETTPPCDCMSTCRNPGGPCPRA